MSVAWPSVVLGSVLTQDTNYVHDLELRPYPKLSVKLYGRGVALDAPTDGGSVKMQKHQLARPGQVILSEIWAKKGAIGVVPSEGAGALCTSHFFLFDIQREKVLPEFISWLIRGNYFGQQLSAEARGTTGYAAIRPKQFLATSIPLPPLNEQRRVVARIDELAAKLEEARMLRRAAEEEVAALPRALLSHAKSKRTIRIGDFATLRPPDVTVDPLTEYHFAGVYSFGRGVFRGQRKLGSEFAYPKLTRLRVGNFTYPKLMAWEGALGVVPPSCDGLVVSTEFPVFEIDEQVMLPEVMDTYFRSPEVWPTLSGQSGGTNVRRRRINPKDFLNLQMPCPDREVQVAIGKCVSRASSIRAIQGETAAELDAMLPAILDKAFKGEL